MHLRALPLIISLAFAGLPLGCRTPSVPEASAEPDIRAVLEKQVRDWNAGDLAGFMAGYARSEQTRFASGNDISLGWQTVFDRYQKKYGTGTAMGTLRFSDLDITPLSPDSAMAFGRYHLTRTTGTSTGLFTLLFRKTSAGWQIVHDHTSAATP